MTIACMVFLCAALSSVQSFAQSEDDELPASGWSRTRPNSILMVDSVAKIPQFNPHYVPASRQPIIAQNNPTALASPRAAVAATSAFNWDKYGTIDGDLAYSYAQIDEVTPLIHDLALTLQTAGVSDPVKIFKFVRDQIETEPGMAAMKGAHLTLLTGSGGCADKAALLAALLKASGYNDVEYLTAQIEMPVAAAESSGQPVDLAAHLGIYVAARRTLGGELQATTNKRRKSAYRMIQKMGWCVDNNIKRISIDEQYSYAVMWRIIVRCDCDLRNTSHDHAKWIEMDPSWHNTAYLPGSDFNATAPTALISLGFDPATFLSNVGGTFGLATSILPLTSFVKGIDESTIAQQYTLFSNKLKMALPNFALDATKDLLPSVKRTDHDITSISNLVDWVTD